MKANGMKAWRKAARRWRRKYLAWLLWSTTAGSFDFARKHYRVGQSLRPCPGCLQCQPKACDG